MNRREFLCQEDLKLIACCTMLLDHIGAVLVPQIWLRCVGRLAFPIYCYLLVEGALHTHSERNYGIRLGIAAILSEIPFDFAFRGGITWEYQNVMVTLLVGLVGLVLCKRTEKLWLQALLWVPLGAIAQWAHGDYGAWGIALIAAFWFGRNNALVRFLLVAAVCGGMPSMRISLGAFRFSVELFAVLALIPIGMSSGKKRWNGKWIQWGFYLFYPVHLAILAILSGK